IHLLTDPLEAPKATAMLCCDQPCCLSSQARKRRHSFQACGDGVVVSMPLFYAEKSFLHCAAVCKWVVQPRRRTHQFTRRGRCNGVVSRENRMRPRSECNGWFGGFGFTSRWIRPSRIRDIAHPSVEATPFQFDRP